MLAFVVRLRESWYKIAYVKAYEVHTTRMLCRESIEQGFKGLATGYLYRDHMLQLFCGSLPGYDIGILLGGSRNLESHFYVDGLLQLWLCTGTNCWPSVRQDKTTVMMQMVGFCLVNNQSPTRQRVSGVLDDVDGCVESSELRVCCSRPA